MRIQDTASLQTTRLQCMYTLWESYVTRLTTRSNAKVLYPYHIIISISSQQSAYLICQHTRVHGRSPCDLSVSRCTNISGFDTKNLSWITRVGGRLRDKMFKNFRRCFQPLRIVDVRDSTGLSMKPGSVVSSFIESFFQLQEVHLGHLGCKRVFVIIASGDFYFGAINFEIVVRICRCHLYRNLTTQGGRKFKALREWDDEYPNMQKTKVDVLPPTGNQRRWGVRYLVPGLNNLSERSHAERRV